MDEILPVFNNLLEHEGYRIKSLALDADLGDKMSNLLSGKNLPALKAFGFRSTGVMEPLAIQSLQSAKHLQCLRISRFPGPSLSSFQLSFHCFKTLHIAFSSCQDTTKFFSTCLPLCHNLESLIVFTTSNRSEIPHACPPLSLPKLISLRTDHYVCVDQIHAPGLKKIQVHYPLALRTTQHKYSIFDEYDVSSVTRLYMGGIDLLLSEPSVIEIGGTSGSTESLGLYHMMSESLDFTEALLPSIPSFEPTRFSFSACYPDDVERLSKNSFLPKFLSKPQNLEIIAINPFQTTDISLQRVDSEVEPLKRIIKTIFDNITSVKLRQLIEDRQGELDVLQILFDLINTYPALSSLNEITFYIDEVFDYHISGHEFGEELVGFLRARRGAGYEALHVFKLVGGEELTGECIAEAAGLGTHVHQESPFSSDSE
ncbi:hypothetical protein Clacol_000903 [Clathrus columnatus]|uniref:Uncharacterized protein n=1 Tax=Clathrus columnatus TaxID=1419009 RepID=A0AAV4ZXC5_9AGAM|nr:hypothetical protein Clacol_000903 [Clathrus columnatus]